MAVKRITREMEVVVVSTPDGNEKVLVNKSIGEVKSMLKDLVPPETIIKSEIRKYSMRPETFIALATHVD